MPVFVVVIGHGPDLEAPEGAATLLRTLGAEVRTLDLWDEGGSLFDEEGATARAIVIEAGERPDLAVAALRAVRKTAELTDVPAIVAVSPRQIARIEPASGFDDFIVLPCVPSELYARIKQLEWKRSEFATEERTKVGRLIVDRAGHEVLRPKPPPNSTIRSSRSSRRTAAASSRGSRCSRGCGVVATRAAPAPSTSTCVAYG